MIAGVGYGPGGATPDDYGYHACPCCNGNPCECHLPEPDPHYEDYLAAWDAALDAGELDDAADAAVERDALVEAGLLGYRVDLGYVGYEALLNGGACLMHEMLHGVFEYTGNNPDNEEHLITSIAPALVDVLRRNPEMTAFLLAPDGKKKQAKE